MAETKNDSSSTVKLATKVKILIGALLITPIAIIIGLASAGAGHGDYLFCKLLFPYMMLSVHFGEPVISGPIAVLSMFQIPIYGILLTLPSKKHVLKVVGISIFVLHLIAVCLYFMIPPPPNFSGSH